MTETLTLSRYRLATFLVCSRRFELRYLRRLPWPAAPLDERIETARQQGEQFHRLLERHFLGLPITNALIENTAVKNWWSSFQNGRLDLPEGKAYPERTLTVPVGGHVLNGRFDLLIIHNHAAHIFDWKTGQPQTEATLRRDWQTRLYLAMLAESGRALGPELEPGQISITYWYVNDPAAPRTIRYSQTWHEQNWADIQALVAQIDDHLTQDDWPLTDDLSVCRQCAYQAYCGRQDAGRQDAGRQDAGHQNAGRKNTEGNVAAESEAPSPIASGLALEPELP